MGEGWGLKILQTKKQNKYTSSKLQINNFFIYVVMSALRQKLCEARDDLTLSWRDNYHLFTLFPHFKIWN